MTMLEQGFAFIAKGDSYDASEFYLASLSLERITSIFRRNVEHFSQGNSLMHEAKSVMENGDQSMLRLTSSIGEIDQASVDIQRIISTIDGIAFQTNLLALNAAVEAARAGDAGAGFAVVAAKVRNLAKRTAQSAKEVESLIVTMVSKVKEGSGLVSETSTAMTGAAAGISRAYQIIDAIAAGAREQNEGIDDVPRSLASATGGWNRTSTRSACSSGGSAQEFRIASARPSAWGRSSELAHRLEHRSVQRFDGTLGYRYFWAAFFIEQREPGEQYDQKRYRQPVHLGRFGRRDLGFRS